MTEMTRRTLLLGVASAPLANTLPAPRRSPSVSMSPKTATAAPSPTPTLPHRTLPVSGSAPVWTFPTTRPFVLGVVGDSVTQRGSFASTYENTWVELVEGRIAAQCPMSVNRVDSVIYHDAQGSTSLASMSTAQAVAGFPAGCDAVIVGLGTNDCREQNADGSWTYSPTSTFDNARTIYQAVASANPAAVIIGLGVWDNSLLSWAPTAGSRTARWDALIGQNCAQVGGIYTPVSDLWDYAPNRLPTGVPAFGGYSTDGFHPDDAGHAAIAARVEEFARIP